MDRKPPDLLPPTPAELSSGKAPHGPWLRTRRLGLHTQREPIVIMRTDCAVCKSEGLAPRSQVRLRTGSRQLAAILFQGSDGMLAPGEVGLSEAAWSLLGAVEGEWVHISHPPPVNSLSAVRRRIFGKSLDQEALDEIVGDVVAGRYSDVQLAAFITGCSARPLSDDETFWLTRAMACCGEQLSWDEPIIDKHCVGGLPGNRTTPIVVAIAAAAGLVIPKTSSRAITSPAGTADAMETVTRVDLAIPAMRAVVEAQGGCLVWGGALRLSPADDIFIGVERQLEIDPEGQLIASVLSKKVAAGANKVALDIPVGPTAKVRSLAAGLGLAARMERIAARFGVQAKAFCSDGSQPVGRSIGPALEMMDVLSVLRLEPDAPSDLRGRALAVSGAVLELGGAALAGDGLEAARSLLEDGSAMRKLENICIAQGGFREPRRAPMRRTMQADRSGRVAAIDNRKIARLAKFCGAPNSPGAGLRLHAKVGDVARAGDPLLTLYSETRAELDYALDYGASSGDAIRVES